MSLNISVATRSAIHQSADFCITEFVPRGSIWVPRTIAQAPKVTVLQYMGWRAVITYVGIAKLDGISTADWLTRTLTHPLGQRSIEEIVEDIRSKASRSLATSVPPGFSKNHTFTMGVLADGAPPLLIVISNFEWLTGPDRNTAENELFVSKRYLGSREPTLVAVSGIPRAVDKNDRELLERIVRNTNKAISIRQKLAEVNRRASSRPRSQGMISPSCAVFSLYADGNGSSEVHGAPANPLIVSTIMGGLDTGAMVRQLFSQQRPGQRPVFRAMTMVSNQRNSEERRGGDFAPDASADQHAENGGIVLIAGGTHQAIHQSAELYDSSKGTFAFTGNLTHPRLYYAAVKLGGGRVLIAGGRSHNESGGVTNSSELFDRETGIFSRSADMGFRRENFNAIRLANGNVLIVGGSNESGAINSAEIYQRAQDVFVSSATIPGPNRRAILLKTGLVLLIGREDTMVEILDPSTGSLIAMGGLLDPRTQHTATLLPSGEVLIAGGEASCPSKYDLVSSEIYDPVERTFRHTGNATTVRIGHTATLLQDGKVLLAGGRRYVKAGHGGIIETILLATCELYDPLSSSFEPTGDMCDVRYSHTATRLNNGEVLIVGGQTIRGTSDGAEIYNPSTGRFRQTGRLNVARLFHTASLLDD